MSDQDPYLSDASETSDGNYSVSKTYCASRDKKGFGTTVRITVPPAFMREISSLVASRKVPQYRTTGDVLRDILVHGLHTKAQVIEDDDFRQTCEWFTTLAEIESAQEERNAQRRAIESVDTLIRGAANSQERDYALGQLRVLASSDQKYLSDEASRLLGIYNSR